MICVIRTVPTLSRTDVPEIYSQIKSNNDYAHFTFFPTPFDHFHFPPTEKSAQSQKKSKMDKKEKDNVVPTRSNRYEYYQYGQVLQTSPSQAPPQVPYRQGNSSQYQNSYLDQ